MRIITAVVASTLAFGIGAPTASAAKQVCQSKKCHQRVAKQEAQQRKADARWCRKDRKCQKRMALRQYQRELYALTPYKGPHGTRWAIPWYIVRCESGGSWSAYNPSGAAGPYQIMAMHGRPFPANTQATRIAHHRIAARLWRGGAGASNWVCA